MATRTYQDEFEMAGVEFSQDSLQEQELRMSDHENNRRHYYGPCSEVIK